MRGLRAALLFMSRIPLPGGARVDDGDLAASVAWYPAVGAILGGLLALAAAGGLALFEPPLAAAIVVALGVALTGAMHEDGLGDAADGLGGAWTRERALEIMRDSRIGAYAGVAIPASLLLRFAALVSAPVERWGLALVVSWALARWAAVLLLVSLPYAREDGKAGPMIRGVRGAHVAWATAVAVGIAALGGARGGLALLSALVVFAAARRFFRRKVGGVTGDLLGAAVVAVEIAALMVFAAR